MTLDKHRIDGVPRFTKRVLPSAKFDALMIGAGYVISGSAPAQGGRTKKWWIHPSYRRVESIYSPDEKIVITAYHV